MNTMPMEYDHLVYLLYDLVYGEIFIISSDIMHFYTNFKKFILLELEKNVIFAENLIYKYYQNKQI